MEDLKKCIRDVPDFPKQGILFKDITTLIKKGDKFKEVIDIFYNEYKQKNIDLILAAEARGFIFAGALAYKLGCGFVPVRKKGKLPSETIEATYDLEYGTDTLCIHKDAISADQNILVLDDLLATGGTAKAMCDLVKKAGGKVAGIAFMIELIDLNGKDKLKDCDIFSMIKY